MILQNLYHWPYLTKQPIKLTSVLFIVVDTHTHITHTTTHISKVHMYIGHQINWSQL